MSNSAPIILVDGSSYLFRAYYALPPLTNSRGMPTGAIYGVINMLRKLIKDYSPEHIAVVFDPKGKTFRHDLYPEYKANRMETPADLVPQFEPLYAAIRALGLPLVIKDGVEADDVIGTLAVQAEALGYSTLISTGDKDMAQLVNDQVTLINTMNNKLYDRQAVIDKFGVPPESIVDYLALVGDSVDNVPGVPKVGPKTAAKWLNEYHTLDNLIQHANDIKGKVGENLRQSLELLSLSRELVTIKTDVELDVSPTDFVPAAQDTATLQQLFSELEFKNWLVEVSEPETLQSTNAATATAYKTILNLSEWSVLLKQLQQAQQIALDTETTSLDAMQAKLVGLSVATNEVAAYVPLAHDYPGAPEQCDAQKVLDDLQPLLTDKTKTIIGQNLKYDLKVLKKAGVEVHAVMRDTMLESYVLNSAVARHDMDSLAMRHLNRSTITFAEVAGKGSKQKTFNEVAIDAAAAYAAEDAEITLALDNVLYSQVKSDAATEKVFREIEMPLMPVLMQMEFRGVLIDAALLQQQSGELEKKISTLKGQIFQQAGSEFNIDSPKQLQQVLFEHLQLPVLQKTPTGQASTAEPVLQELAHDYEIPALILEYRSLSKIKSTYVDKLPLLINPGTGRVHTNYNQAVTSTGRLSSNEPNLQNIPVRTEEGRRIRQAFVAPTQYKIVAADYSQIELRLMAHLSKDPGLLQAFSENLDVHSATAAEVFSVPLDQVTPLQRRNAKAINFGLIYGMSAWGLSRQLKISREEAQQYIDVYFNRYPGVHDYMEKARLQASQSGYVDTLLGRRLYIEEIHSKNAQRRNAAERQAINAPLQGSAADIIKKAMLCIDHWLQQSDIEVHMIMQVHDELVFEIKETVLETAVAKIRDCMQSAIDLDVPLIVDIGVGDNWNEAH